MGALGEGGHVEAATATRLAFHLAPSLPAPLPLPEPLLKPGFSPHMTGWACQGPHIPPATLTPLRSRWNRHPSPFLFNVHLPPASSVAPTSLNVNPNHDIRLTFMVVSMRAVPTLKNMANVCRVPTVYQILGTGTLG